MFEIYEVQVTELPNWQTTESNYIFWILDMQICIWVISFVLVLIPCSVTTQEETEVPISDKIYQISIEISNFHLCSLNTENSQKG